MDSFSTWVLRGLNAKQSKSRLLQISDLIDWVANRHELDEMYDNKSEKRWKAQLRRYSHVQDPNISTMVRLERSWNGKINGRTYIIYGILAFQITSLIQGQYGCSRSAWLRPRRIKSSERNFKDNWRLWVYALSAERCKMLHSLKQIRIVQQTARYLC